MQQQPKIDIYLKGHKQKKKKKSQKLSGQVHRVKMEAVSPLEPRRGQMLVKIQSLDCTKGNSKGLCQAEHGQYGW